MGPLSRLRGALAPRRSDASAGPRTTSSSRAQAPGAPDLIELLGPDEIARRRAARHSAAPAVQSSAAPAAPDLAARLDDARARLRATIPPQHDE